MIIQFTYSLFIDSKWLNVPGIKWAILLLCKNLLKHRNMHVIIQILWCIHLIYILLEGFQEKLI